MANRSLKNWVEQEIGKIPPPHIQPHRRFNPLKNEWLIVSPHRAQRPWQGQKEQPSDDQSPVFDPKNPLCPRALRPCGEQNPDYERTFVFQNDFPALLPTATTFNADKNQHPLFKTDSSEGECRVMCFHRRSDLQLATMDLRDISAVIDCWCEQTAELGQHYQWVQIFENKGAIMGCSNKHPHCQIWASRFLPNEPATKHATQAKYYQERGTPMLIEYVREEIERQERVVCQNDHWLVVVPFWAVWPYETMLLPKRHVMRLTQLTDEEKRTLAAIMKEALIRYDNLFQCSFPYSMGWHGAPTGTYLTQDCQHWQLHAVYLPPLLRSASVKKFMAGYEMICEPQRDITPEAAAKTLRELPTVHYKDQRAQRAE